MQIIELKKNYPVDGGEPVEALRGVTFSLPSRGMVFILGRSGSGKTTLLNILAGFDDPTSGSVIYRGRNVATMTDAERDDYRNIYCGFIFQDYNLLPELTVEENISLAAELRGHKDAGEEVREMLARVGLEGYEKRDIYELSGGQRQRVAVARALIKSPEIIFADEPTGALDSATGEEIMSLLKEYSRKKLVVVITHERDYALKYGDRILTLSDGKIISDSSPLEGEDDEPPFAIGKGGRMPAKTALKLGCTNFRFHPVRLVLTFILSFVSFVVFGVSLTLVTADSARVKAEALVRSGENIVTVTAYSPPGKVYGMTEEECARLSSRIGSAVIPIFIPHGDVTEPASEISLPFSDELAPYYAFQPHGAAFVTMSELGQFSCTVEGAFPSSESEVMLTRYFAEKVYFAYNDGDFSAQSVIGTEVKIGSAVYTVSGIVGTPFDFSPYSALKGLEEVPSSPESYNYELYYSLDEEMGYSPEGYIYFSRDVYGSVNGYTAVFADMSGKTRGELVPLISFSDGGVQYDMTNSAIEIGLQFFGRTMESYTHVIAMISGIFCLLSEFMLIYFVSQSVEDKYGAIALLKTLGVSKGQTLKIFMAESIIFGAAIFILTLICVPIGCAYMNAAFAVTIYGVLPVYAFSFMHALALFAAIAFGSLVGGLVPLRKVNKSRGLNYIGY